MQPYSDNYNTITSYHDAWLAEVNKLREEMQSATSESDLETIQECATAAIRTTSNKIEDLQLNPQPEKRSYKATKRLLAELLKSEEQLSSKATREVRDLLSQAIHSTKELKKALKEGQQHITGNRRENPPPISLPAKTTLASSGNTPDEFWDKPAIEALLKTKGNIDQTRQGYSPLAFAVFKNDSELIEALLQAGADPNQSVKSTPIIFEVLENCSEETALMFVKSGLNKNETNEVGSPLLATAIQLKKFQLADALIESPLPPSLSNLSMALAQAIIHSGNSKYMDLFSEILPRISPRQLTEQLLIKVIKTNNSEALALLLDQEGIDVNEYITNDETPLMIAALHDSFECFELLLKAGANIRDLIISPPSLSPSLPSNSVIDELKANNSPHYHKILTLLKKAYKEEILTHKEKYRISALGHSCKLSGSVKIKPKRALTGKSAQPFVAFLEFGATSHWLKKMVKVTKIFSQKYPDLLSTEECTTLCETLDFASKWKTVDPSEVVTRVHQGMPTILITGYTAKVPKTDITAGHCVMLNTYGPFFGVCNRRNPGTPITFGRFNPERLLKTQLLNLDSVVMRY